MSVFDQTQNLIDRLGYVDQEISSANAANNYVSSGGKEEYEFYQNQIYLPSDRIQRLAEYEQMSKYAELGSGLNIYADDSTQQDQDKNRISISTEDDDIKKELEELFYKKLCINHSLWDIVRTTCLYGDGFYELLLQKDRKGILGLKKLPPKTMFRVEENSRLRGFFQVSPNGEPVKFMPFEIIHFKLLSSLSEFAPYGYSILENVRQHWRQLKLMEDAMVVYRITRAPERRVFNIDVGNLTPQQAEAYVERQRQKFRKRQFVNQATGEIDWRANSIAPDEDFFIPKKANGEGTTIDQLSGASNLDEIADVNYLKSKIFAGLLIPRIWLQDVEGSEERKQNLSQQDIRFSRTVERVQSQILVGLKKIAIVHLLLRGFKKSQLDDFELQLTPPSNLNEQIEMEMLDTKARTADSLKEFGFSKQYLVSKLFDISEDEWTEQWEIRNKEKSADDNMDGDAQNPYKAQTEEPEKEDQEQEFIQFENKTPVFFKLLSEGEVDGMEPRKRHQNHRVLNEQISVQKEQLKKRSDNAKK